MGGGGGGGGIIETVARTILLPYGMRLSLCDCINRVTPWCSAEEGYNSSNITRHISKDLTLNGYHYHHQLNLQFSQSTNG